MNKDVVMIKAKKTQSKHSSVPVGTVSIYACVRDK